MDQFTNADIHIDKRWDGDRSRKHQAPNRRIRESLYMGQLTHNLALDLAPFGRWTLRDKAAQRRSALR